MSIIERVSSGEGCLLRGVPLYYKSALCEYFGFATRDSENINFNTEKFHINLW